MPNDFSPNAGNMVNRTHRAVRARALQMNAQRSRVRSLWMPLCVGAALLSIACVATMTMLAQYDATPDGTVDATAQIFIFLLWFVPATAVALAIVWYRRDHSAREVSR